LIDNEKRKRIQSPMLIIILKLKSQIGNPNSIPVEQSGEIDIERMKGKETFLKINKIK